LLIHTFNKNRLIFFIILHNIIIEYKIKKLRNTGMTHSIRVSVSLDHREEQSL